MFINTSSAPDVPGLQTSGAEHMKSFLKQIIVRILTLEAQITLARCQPTIIAVTGTVGKTSAKDAIAAALAPFVAVRKSEKSYNSDIGVPLAILGEKNQWNNPFGWCAVLARGAFRAGLGGAYPRFLVVEVGTDRPGDIHAIVRWLKPHLVVVTKLSRAPVHVENFSSVGELIAEKGTLVSSVRKGGTLILNADDADVRAFRALAPQGTKVISFGFREGADVRADDFSSLVTVQGALGAPHLYAALAALAVAKALGFDLARAAAALSKRALAPGRMRLLEGIRGARIIDDTYNSSPVAVAEALRALSGARGTGRAVAVLGDMLELGELSEREHQKMGTDAAQSAGILFFVGEKSRAAAAAARKTGFPQECIREFSDSRTASEALAQELKSNDLVLIKGSQGMRMERIVERIMAEPVRAPELLVRQEPEWSRR